ncbi:hypothetical protein KR009_006044, partial [Drosophila setifemur]
TNRGMRFYRKYKLLLWKDFQVLLSNPVEYILLIAYACFIPMLFAIVMNLVKIDSPEKPAKVYERKSVNASLPDDLYFSPNNKLIATLMNDLAKDSQLKSIKGFKNDSSLERALNANNKALGIAFPDFWAKIDKYPNGLQFTIYIPAHITRRDFKYFDSGFLLVQERLTKLYIKKKHAAAAKQLPNVEMIHYPYPAHKENYLGDALWAMPYVVQLSFFLPVTTIVKYIVAEKETKKKALMNCMGIQNSIHWLAWYTKSMMLLLLCLVIFIPCVIISNVFAHSNLIAILVFFLVYIHSCTMFTFLVSAFCSRTYWSILVMILLFFVTVVPYAIEEKIELGLANEIVSCMFFNSALFYVMELISVLEVQSIGLQWETITTTVVLEHKLSILAILVIMLVASLISLLVCLYVEQVHPGEYGIPHSWYYPCTRQYWCPRRRHRRFTRMLPVTTEAPATDYWQRLMRYVTQRPGASVRQYRSAGIEGIQANPEDKSVGVAIKDLCKSFGNYDVVKNLSFNMYEGEITVLLGPNAAGKTTLILTLCGILAPTSGTARIEGYDIVRSGHLATKRLGVCPQQNVLFKGLNVSQHIYFFSRSKGKSAAAAHQDALEYMTKLDLKEYRNRDATMLSKGNQRRLSLACALCGNAKVVFCDDPTSGLDPSARHNLWALLEKEKRDRTILLITQHLDDAEMLADRVAIMVKGRLCNYGTLDYLKRFHRAAYTLSCLMGSECHVEKLTQLVRRYIPSATASFEGVYVHYKLEHTNARKIKEMFYQLEEYQNQFNVICFSLSDSCLKHIFLTVKEKNDPRVKGGTDRKESGNIHIQIESEKTPRKSEEIQPNRISKEEHESIEEPESTKEPEPELELESRPERRSTTPLSSRKRTCLVMCRAMILKKFLYTCTHICIFVVVLLIPLAFIFTLAMLDTVPRKRGFDDQPVLPLTLDIYNDNMIILLEYSQSLKKEAHAYGKLVAEPSSVRLLDNIFAYILNAPPLIRRDINRKFICGATFVNPKSVIAWYNKGSFKHSPPIAMNMVYNALGQAAVGKGFSIAVNRGVLDDNGIDERRQSGHKFFGLNTEYVDNDFTESSSNDIAHIIPALKDNLQFGQQITTRLMDSMEDLGITTIVASLYVSLAVSIFVLFVTQERVQKAQLQQEILGLNKFYFWLSHFVWDYLTFIIFMFFLTLGLYAHSLWYNVLGILSMIGFACLPLNYLLSLAFNKPETAFATAFIVNVFLGGMFFCFLYVITFISNTNIGIYFVFLPMVVGCYGLLKSISWTLYCRDKTIQDRDLIHCYFGSIHPYCACDALVLWPEIWYLLVHGIIWFFLLWLVRQDKCFYLLALAGKKFKNDFDVNGNVLNEAKLVDDIERGDRRTYPLILDKLKKNYCRTQAVKNISIAVKPGECFGLLGANGAGKTSTFRMILGDMAMTAGDIYVKGHSVRSELTKAKMKIGYCPESDDLPEYLTGRQAVQIYLMLKGVPTKNIKWESDELGDEFDIQDLLDIKIKHYSVGTKRKLNIALVTNGPKILCLDEPNASVDPSARKIVLEKLEDANKDGSSVVMSSHRMQDVTGTYTRIGFLVSGVLKFIGSLQEVQGIVSRILVLKLRVH